MSQECKKVKYSEVQERTSAQFPDIIFTNQVLCDFVKNTFPTSFNKRLGKSREMYAFGIEPSYQQRGSEVEQLQEQVAHLQHQVAEMEKSKSYPVSIVSMDEQLTSVMNPSNSVMHGTDATQHFKQFTVEIVIQELKEHAPDVYDLFTKLALPHRHTQDDSDTPLRVDQLNVVIALCTLLKGRSIRVLGLQLLIAFMLIARATNKQVRKSLIMLQKHCVVYQHNNVYII